MDQVATLDPVLTRFRDEVRAFYGERLERLVLFGSRARGDFHADSDYDVAVFLHDMGSFWKELQPLCGITARILIDRSEYVSAKPFPAGSYLRDTGLMRAIRTDGIDL